KTIGRKSKEEALSTEITGPR
ncbi:unnamed protein product, partial [Oikopleura dioica]